MGISLNQLKNTVTKIKAYVDNHTPKLATTSTAGVVKPDGTTITIDENGVITGTPDIKEATNSKIGLVKPDIKTIIVDESGKISAVAATTESLGIVQPDDSTIAINEDGVISAKMATKDSIGVVKPDDKTIKIATKTGEIYAVTATDEKFGITMPSTSKPHGYENGLGIQKDGSMYVKAASYGSFDPIKQEFYGTLGGVTLDSKTFDIDAYCITHIKPSGISHSEISDSGTFSHVDIDAHINNTSIHSVDSIGKLELSGSAFELAQLEHLVMNNVGNLELEYNEEIEAYYANGSMLTSVFDTSVEDCEMRYLFHYGIYDSDIVAIKTYMRAGSTSVYDTNTWTAWKQVSITDGSVKDVRGKYAQIRMDVFTADQEQTPTITKLILYYGVSTNEEIRNAMGSYSSIDARFKAVEKNTDISEEEKNTLTRLDDGLYTPAEVYIGTGDEDVNYKIFVDTDDTDPKELNIQADWFETDTTLGSYIKNKPTIPSLDGYATEGYVGTEIGKLDILKISKRANNQVQRDADGIYVAPTTLDIAVSKVAGNMIQTLADGYYVSNLVANPSISKDTNNLLSMHSDGLYVRSSVVTDSVLDINSTNPIQNKAVAQALNSATGISADGQTINKNSNNVLSVKISTETGNIITTDNGLYASLAENYTTEQFEQMVNLAINELSQGGNE